jgi:pantoate--beta-alanine ligase
MVPGKNHMVRVFTTTQDLLNYRNEDKDFAGFVPTMGNLHAGHISLLEEALRKYRKIYFSIFVNPKQFGPDEDFARYPRTLQNDLSLIERSLDKFPGSEVIVYAPKHPEEVFPPGNNRTISVWGLKDLLEGALRPGHFDGVATVVYRLFEMVRPASAYFGLKDYQQWLVIRQMTQDLKLPVEIVGMPIIREASGLALSSRNQYLDLEQKRKALVLYNSLVEIVKILDNQRSNLTIAQKRIDKIKYSDPHWNYLELRDAETLGTDLSHSRELTLLGVYQLGATRLLDNMQVTIK